MVSGLEVLHLSTDFGNDAGEVAAGNQRVDAAGCHTPSLLEVAEVQGDRAYRHSDIAGSDASQGYLTDLQSVDTTRVGDDDCLDGLGHELSTSSASG